MAQVVVLVQNLHAMSNGGEQDPIGLRSDRKYQDALHAFWRGDAKSAADRISRYLIEEPESAVRFAAYRLWVETLADQADASGLVALGEHLFQRGREDEEYQARYVALRGLVHLELDEVSAAKLLARCVKEETDDPYCLELEQRVESRFGVSDVPALARSSTRLDDYFHWQTLSRALIAQKEEEALQEALSHIRSYFRGSPLPQLTEFHRSVEKGYFAAAAMMAERLCEMNPDSVDYSYYHAYALFEDGNYPASRRILTDVVRKVGETDPEVVGLLGHCHAKLGEPERAQHFLRRAVSLLKADGLPASHVSLELANVEDELRGEAIDPAIEMPREPQNWLVKLSPRRYNELLTSSESSVERLLRPMGKKPLPGDYCFFVSEENTKNKREGTWYVVGVYVVDSEPMWHPTQGYHTALRLVTRPHSGIPLSFAATDDAADHVHTNMSKEDPRRYGVFQIELGTLEILERLKMNQDEMIERRRNAQSRRPTA